MSISAKQQYLRGAGLYKTQKFAAAAQAFTAAYAQYPSTRLLYDLGQSYRRQGQTQKALQSYEQFLAEERGLPPNLQAGIRGYIAQLQGALGRPAQKPAFVPKVMPDLLDPALGPRPLAPAATASPGPAAAPPPPMAPAAAMPSSPAAASPPMAGMPVGPPVAMGLIEALPRRQLPGKWAIIDPKPGYTLRRVQCASPDVFVIGDSSFVLAATGGQTTFEPLRTGLPNWFSAVWGTPANTSGSGELFIGGDSGLVLRRVGPQLHAVASGIRGTVFAFAGGASDWFAFGEAGGAARWDGNGFVSVPAATANAILGAFAVDNEVFAVGAGGAILRWGGASFTSMPSPTRAMLQGIWGTSKNELWAVGTQGTILRYDGSGWRSVPSGTAQTLLAIWGSARNNIFAVGTAGLVLHYDGVSWGAVDVGAGALLQSAALSGICGRPTGEIFVASDSVILRYKR